MSVRQYRAWRAFHKLRGQLLPHLAKNINKNTGLTPSEFFLLITLIDSPMATLHSYEIAEKLDWEKSRVSHQITRMEERGLVNRKVCPSDARSCLVELTPSGRKYLKKALPNHFEDVKHCFADLLTAAQLDTLIEISSIVTKHLAVEHFAGESQSTAAIQAGKSSDKRVSTRP